MRADTVRIVHAVVGHSKFWTRPAKTAGQVLPFIRNRLKFDYWALIHYENMHLRNF